MSIFHEDEDGGYGDPHCDDCGLPYEDCECDEEQERVTPPSRDCIDADWDDKRDEMRDMRAMREDE